MGGEESDFVKSQSDFVQSVLRIDIRDIDCSRTSSPVAVKWSRRPHRPWIVGVSRTWLTNMLAN